MEYADDDELMKEVEPDWSEWVANPHLNCLGKWLVEVDLGKPPSDKEKAQERFGIGWSSEEERCHSGIFFAFFRHFSTLFICIFLEFPLCFMPIPFYSSRIL